MAGVTVGWDETDPANNKNAGLGAGDIRSMKTAVRSAVAAEHVFSATGGAGTGAHLLGSARAFEGASSELSSDGTTGRLYFNTTTNQAYYLSDTTAKRLGGVGVPYVGDDATTFSITNHRTNIYCGVVRTGSAGTIPITFNSAYSGLPFIQLTAFNDGVIASVLANVTALSPTSMTVSTVRAADGAVASLMTVFWQSTGSAHHLQTMA